MVNLLDLPSEILNKVYSYSLPFESIVEILPPAHGRPFARRVQHYKQNAKFNQPMRWGQTLSFAYGLLGACRKIRADNLMNFCTSNTFIFRYPATSPSRLRLHHLKLRNSIRSIVIFECIELALGRRRDSFHQVLGWLCRLTSFDALQTLKILLSVDDCCEQAAIQPYLEAWQAQVGLGIQKFTVQVYHCVKHDAQHLRLGQEAYKSFLVFPERPNPLTANNGAPPQSALDYVTRSCVPHHQYWDFELDVDGGTWAVERYTYLAEGRVRILTLDDHLKAYRRAAISIGRDEALVQLRQQGAVLADAPCHNPRCSRDCSSMPHDLRYSRPFWCPCGSVVFCGKGYCSIGHSDRASFCVWPQSKPPTFPNFRQPAPASTSMMTTKGNGTDKSLNRPHEEKPKWSEEQPPLTAPNAGDCNNIDADEQWTRW